MRRVWRIGTRASVLGAVLLVILGAATALARPRPAARQRSSIVAVSAPIGAAVDTMAPRAGGGYEITIGGNCLPNQAGCVTRHYPYTGAVQMIVLSRSTLTPVVARQLGAGLRSAAIAFSLTRQYAGGRYLAILAGLPRHPINPLFGDAASSITGAPLPVFLHVSGGWSAIGVPTWPPKTGRITGVLNAGAVAGEHGHPRGDLRGYFQQNLNPNTLQSRYSFVRGRYASYNTYASGSGGTTDVMTIGGARYTLTLSSTPACTGGYAVVVLDGPTLRPISQAAIATNCASAAEDQAGLARLHGILAGASGVQSGSELVFMQSIGNPSYPDGLNRSLAAEDNSAIEALGGSAEIWNRSLAAGGPLSSGKSGYAMVGSVAIQGDAPAGSRYASYAPQVATAVTGHARLQGLLRSDWNNNYVPVTGAAFQTTLYPSLSTIVFGRSMAWPTGASAGQLKVLKYISDGMPRRFATLNLPDRRYPKLKYTAGSSCYAPVVPDVRFAFCDSSVDWNTISSELVHHGAKHPPSGCNCKAADWGPVRDDLIYEISLRHTVASYLSNLERVFGSGTSCANALVSLESITSKIRNAVTVSNNAAIAGGSWDGLVSDAFNIVSSIFYTAFPDGSIIANVLNNVSSVGYLTGDLLGFSESANSLASEVNTTAAQLGPKLQQVYCNSQQGFGLDEQIILSDYGKLLAAGSSKGFQTSLKALNRIQPTLKNGAKRFIYNHLLGAVYHPYALLESDYNPVYFHNEIGNRTTPLTYACDVEGAHFRPWSKAAAGDWTELSLYDPPLGQANREALGIVFSEPFTYGYLHPANYPGTPPQSVISTVTNPVSAGGLGEDPIDLFLHNFPRYAVLCSGKGFHVSGPSKTYGPLDIAWP